MKVTKFQRDLAAFRQHHDLLVVNRGHDAFNFGILGVQASVYQLIPGRVQRPGQLTGSEVCNAARNDDRCKQSRTGNAVNLAEFPTL